MKTFIKLLLLAAVALPAWLTTAAQDVKHERLVTEDPSVTAAKKLRATDVTESSMESLSVLPEANVTDRKSTPSRAAGDAASSGVYEANVTFADNICRGAELNRYIPAYGTGFNYSQKTTMIYPASLVGLSKGDVISSLTFYIDETAFYAPNQVRLTISETDATLYSNSNTYTNTTICYTGSMPTGSNSKLTFNLTTSYTYNGGNLAIQLEKVSGNYSDSYNAWFYGIIATSGSSYSTYNGAQSFLPQLTIRYTSSKARVSGNKEFFSGISYDWQDDEGTHTSTLDQIATKPDQIIAMLREVYTNKAIPGNYQRGYSQTGELENYVYNDVSYGGLGKLGLDEDGYIYYDDTYGWNAESDEICDAGTYTVGDYKYRCVYMNPNQYKPDYDGLTLLLLETVDEYDPDKAYKSMTETSGYAQLKEYISKTIKSARIITEAKRTGNISDLSSGTLFKIDCDKMNEFYLVAKGQLRWLRSAYYEKRSSNWGDFYEDPCYYYRNSNNQGYSDADIELYYLLGHMFEQFSPVDPSATQGQADLYREMVDDMNSFPVKHDCVNVPYIGEIKNNAFTGNVFSHHFRMYGAGSSASDCADVRDMMFFVPDYRMIYSSSRGQLMSGNTSKYFQDYYNYGKQPKMGMFVIRQNTIPDIGPCTNNEYWKHQLQWRSNLDDFLPTDEQYYELWEVVVDDFGVESYKPVYYRDENGNYTKANGEPSDEPVHIIINKNDSHLTTYTDGDGVKWLTYSNVVVKREQGSQTKTYVIRARDKGDEKGPLFSLQTSNQEEISIPGLDENEKARLVAATYYSRYNPQNEKNCYSNRIELPNNGMALTSADLSKTLKFYRTSRVERYDENGDIVIDINKELFATGTFNTTNRTLNIALVQEKQASEDDYPAGATDVKNGAVNYRAGYHSNGNLSFGYRVNNQGYINFAAQNPCRFWDNFTVVVSENKHPRQYLYKMEVVVGENLDSYSNEVRVPVYKTEMEIKNKRTLDEVLGDINCKDKYTPGKTVEIDEQIQFSGKNEILRYDVYRWKDPVEGQSSDDDYLYRYIVDKVNANDDEKDISPNGIAQNQGEYYSVTMNDIAGPADFYYVASGSEIPTVSTDNPYSTATFVDKYPAYEKDSSQSSEAETTPVASYTYAPVVELITKGFDVNGEDREDYNTYGAPLQNVAVGRLKVKVVEPDEDHRLISRYRWFDGGDWYSYYNIYLQFEALDIPAGYELYKVRAWRQVEKGAEILGEELTSRAARSEVGDGWYMYEDINFGDQIDATGTKKMSCNTVASSLVGDRPTSIPKPVNPDGTGGGRLFDYDLTPNQNGNGNQYVEQNVSDEVRATFGARRLKNVDENPGTLENLKANFKVRAYFTKNSNPLTITGKLPQAKPIYVIGNRNMSYEWDPTTSIGALYTEDGLTYTGSVVVNDTNDPKPYDDYSDEGYGYFSFTKRLGSWESINDGSTRLGYTNGGNCWLVEGNGTTHWGEELNCSYATEPAAYRVPAGTYNVKLTLDPEGNNHKVIITNGGAAQAPSRASENPYDYDYYIAEGTAEFESSGNTIITGIGAVKMDVNREVVGVTYVNTIGQVSSTPWQGVNMVVTRYSDGSTTTQKVIK